jgi:hypothetical protein
VRRGDRGFFSTARSLGAQGPASKYRGGKILALGDPAGLDGRAEGDLRRLRRTLRFFHTGRPAMNAAVTVPREPVADASRHLGFQVLQPLEFMLALAGGPQR